jgi:hypothetical protein
MKEVELEVFFLQHQKPFFFRINEQTFSAYSMFVWFFFRKRFVGYLEDDKLMANK